MDHNVGKCGPDPNDKTTKAARCACNPLTGSRRVHFAGCTLRLEAVWMTQQARNFTLLVDSDMRFRISSIEAVQCESPWWMAKSLCEGFVGVRSSRLCATSPAGSPVGFGQEGKQVTGGAAKNRG